MLYRVCPNRYDNPISSSLAAALARTDGQGCRLS